MRSFFYSISPSSTLVSVCLQSLQFTPSTNRLVCNNINRLLQPMRSRPLAVVRRAQGSQPDHDVPDSRFHYFRILSIFASEP